MDGANRKTCPKACADNGSCASSRAQDAKVAYVATNAYRNGDDRPMIVRTADIGPDLAERGRRGPSALRPGRSDPRRSGESTLLYTGTHFGLFASFDQGGKWMRLGDVPDVRVDDLQIHPRTADLVIATHGRSIYILDDTRPLRDLTPEIAAKPAHLFPVAPVNGAYQLPGWMEWERDSGEKIRRRARSSLFG